MSQVGVKRRLATSRAQNREPYTPGTDATQTLGHRWQAHLRREAWSAEYISLYISPYMYHLRRESWSAAALTPEACSSSSRFQKKVDMQCAVARWRARVSLPHAG